MTCKFQHQRTCAKTVRLPCDALISRPNRIFEAHCIGVSCKVTSGGGDGGFSSFARIFGGCSTIHFRLHFVVVVVVVIVEVEISSHTLIPLFGPGSVHSGPAS